MLSSKDSFEFKPLFDIILLNLRERNAANGGEELLRLRAYEKLRACHQGAVKDGHRDHEEIQGVPTNGCAGAEMKALRAACDERALAKAAARNLIDVNILSSASRRAKS